MWCFSAISLFDVAFTNFELNMVLFLTISLYVCRYDDNGNLLFNDANLLILN
jgi:hypothetical protein